MERHIFEKLIQWKGSPRRKPLILNGARQVGKTYALKRFGEMHYDHAIYLNFEQDESLCEYFAESLEPSRLLKVLGLHANATISPGSTLLIFDEIQECPRALNSLKYFCEQANEYHIVAAGSLLGVKTANEKGFPVGKVNFLHLYPLCFMEFLSAMGESQLIDFLASSYDMEPLPEPIHNKLIGFLKEYLFVGGMPEAVKTYRDHNDYSLVREVHLEILAAYERDFAKHAPADQIMKINAIWQQTSQQLARENKKFMFSQIRKSARSRDYEEAIAWLTDAGLLLKSHSISSPKLPLEAYAEVNKFKLFLLDVGLLGAKVRLSPRTLIEGNVLFTEYKGALTESYVAQELIATLGVGLYYWSSSGSAEVDFILQMNDQVYPLEAKAGVSTKKKSLQSYAEKYDANILLRAALLNRKHDGKLYNFPLYLLSSIEKTLYQGF